MKKSIFLFALTIFSLTLLSQARLGSTASDIRSEFSNSQFNLNAGSTDDGTRYIKIDTDRASVIYYFTDDKICYATAIIPDNQGALNFYVELYNKQYVIESSRKWKMYNTDGIANIELLYSEDLCYFLWSNHNNETVEKQQRATNTSESIFY